MSGSASFQRVKNGDEQCRSSPRASPGVGSKVLQQPGIALPGHLAEGQMATIEGRTRRSPRQTALSSVAPLKGIGLHRCSTQGEQGCCRRSRAVSPTSPGTLA